MFEVAARLTGALGGAATGIFAGPLAGAGAGLAVSEGLAKLVRAVAPTADEVLRGPLGPRQEERAVAVVGFALERIRGRQDAGEEIRGDGFLDERDGHRSSAAELLEGVMNEAVHSYNERRVRHLGWLWASFVFDRRPAGDAYYLFDTAQRLTYRQMVAFAVIAEQSEVLPDWEGDSLLDMEEPALFAELTHLGRNRLLVRSHGQAVTTIDQLNPADMVPATLGERLIEGLGLKDVPPSDRAEITQALWRLNASVRARQRQSPPDRHDESS